MEHTRNVRNKEKSVLQKGNNNDRIIQAYAPTIAHEEEEVT